MTTLKISLLGGLRLSWGEQALPALSPLKLEALLAFLLLHRQQPIPRDELAERLWPDRPAAEARANLRRHLHLLRQALPEGEWILTDHEMVQWNSAADFWLDVEMFTRSAQAGGECELCLELYQGDLLPELYDDWLIPEREKLAELLLQALQRAVEQCAGQGNYAGALRYAQRLLVYDPLHEETHRMAMRLAYLAGDRQAALRQFEECRDLLRRELDVDPMPATLELHRAILEGQPVPRPAQEPTGRALAVPAREPAVIVAPAIVIPSVQARRRRWTSALIGAAAVLLLVVLLLSLRSFRAPQHPAPLVIGGPASVQDTWITEAFPNDTFWPDDPDRTPHHRYTRTHLQYYDRHALDRILIRFDLSALPPDVQIQSATFEIHLETWLALESSKPVTRPFPAAVSVFQVTRAWQPEQATFNQAAVDQAWAQPGLSPGADFISSPLDTESINGTAWLVFDVRQAVSEWQRHPDRNYGLVLMITEAPEDMAHYWVDMTDAGAPPLRPVLRITWH
ncbi:MAG: BTAD domain-containing putative transcriptional regulator [Anaerolineae bacterium]